MNISGQNEAESATSPQNACRSETMFDPGSTSEGWQVSQVMKTCSRSPTDLVYSSPVLIYMSIDKGREYALSTSAEDGIVGCL